MGLVACLVGCGGSGSDDTSYRRSTVTRTIAFSNVYLHNGESQPQRMRFANCVLDALLSEGFSLKEIHDHHTGGKGNRNYDMYGPYIRSNCAHIHLNSG